MRAALLLTLGAGLLHGGESATPPEGPPWMRDFHAARAKALAEGKPLFLYFTKTY